MEIIFLVVGLALGLIIGWMIGKSNSTASSSDNLLLDAQKEIAVLTGVLAEIKQTSTNKDSIIEDLNRKQVAQEGEVSKWKTNCANLEQKFSEEKKNIELLFSELKAQFTNIANEVVVQNSTRIQEEHKSKLDDVLTPFKQKIEKFEQEIKDNHIYRVRENEQLKEQLGLLHKANISIGEEAKNLTAALKGQVKTQGNWGEMILETVLEKSGLVKGREYVVQSSMTTEDGRRLQPDVIINLPEGRNLVVDSKVSLIAYERFFSETEEALKEQYIKEHINSIRKHIKDLSSKNYQNLYKLQTLDFVMLFIPVEPAFIAAVDRDPELFNEAFQNNIVIVSTSTLLATLRTVANIWRLENQNKNAAEIARQAADLFDKISAHIDDLVMVGKRLDDAQGSYESAMNKLNKGKGNIVSRIDNLKKLGLKTSKQLNQKVIDTATDLDESQSAVIDTQ
ncbi:MAG: DNA recombination protein RmuC [Bacteroidota bacterium]